jgi:5-methylcytosine-specific restriction endonuclease McrA
MQTKYQPLVTPNNTGFVEPIPDDYFIWWLFRNRCIICMQPATEINEIIPRSRSKNSLLDWSNRVTVCQSCHRAYHDKGTNDKNIKRMQEQRLTALHKLGRSEYIDINPLPLD